MRKEELVCFLMRYNRWRDGADVPSPRDEDVRTAVSAAIAVIGACDSDVSDFVLRDYVFSKDECYER